MSQATDAHNVMYSPYPNMGETRQSAHNNKNDGQDDLIRQEQNENNPHHSVTTPHPSPTTTKTTTATTTTTTPAKIPTPQPQRDEIIKPVEITYPLLKPKPIPGLFEYQQAQNLKNLKNDANFFPLSSAQPPPTNINNSTQHSDYQNMDQIERELELERQARPKGYKPAEQPSNVMECGNCKAPYALPQGSTTWRCKGCGKFQNVGSDECSLM